MNVESSDPLVIEITSDFICPWCFVAERRLKQAAQEAGVNIRLTFKPFELNPEMPPEGMKRKTYRTSKFGSWEYSQRLDAGTIKASAEDDLTFSYDKMEMTPNTRKVHLLVAFTIEHDPNQEEALVDRLFEAYFTDGLDLGDPAVLLAIAASFSLDTDSLETYWNSDDAVQEHTQNIIQALRNGVHGVPSMAIGEYAYSGAVPKQDLVKALKHTAAAKHGGGGNAGAF